MPSGGPREGAPGQQYSNRTDMQQAPSAAPGQQYGKAKQQIDAQQVAPLPQAPGATAFDRPSERPQEPVTAGLPTGPGAGPEALGPVGPGAQTDEVSAALNALYRASGGDPSLGLLIELRDRGY